MSTGKTFTKSYFSNLVNAFVNKNRSPLGMRGDPGICVMLFSAGSYPATLPVQTPSELNCQYSPSTSKVALAIIPPFAGFR